MDEFAPPGTPRPPVSGRPDRARRVTTIAGIYAACAAIASAPLITLADVDVCARGFTPPMSTETWLAWTSFTATLAGAGAASVFATFELDAARERFAAAVGITWLSVVGLIATQTAADVADLHLAPTAFAAGGVAGAVIGAIVSPAALLPFVLTELVVRRA